jgi:hypothetical protein
MTGSAIAICLGNRRAGRDRRESSHMTARRLGHHYPSGARAPQCVGPPPASNALFCLVFENGNAVALTSAGP